MGAEHEEREDDDMDSQKGEALNQMKERLKSNIQKEE